MAFIYRDWTIDAELPDPKNSPIFSSEYFGSSDPERHHEVALPFIVNTINTVITIQQVLPILLVFFNGIEYIYYICTTGVEL